MAGTDAGAEAKTNALDPCNLEIRVLGPVEVAWADRPVDVGGVKARALVARLLIDRNIVVSVDVLAESLWGDHDDRTAQIALRSTISRLRKRLRAAGGPGDLIVTRSPGYVLEAPAAVTDLYRFEQLVTEARRELGGRRPSEATRLLLEADALWRGSAYSEVRDEPFARAEARRLEELRLSANETRIDALLTMGRHAALVGELEALTSAHPMRERLWSQRMLALYRSGRQAEALRVFQDLRSILVAELGIEPGHDVAWMEHAILRHEPALDFPVPPERRLDDPPEEPFDATPVGYRVRLPALEHDSPFVGRQRESAVLRRWWSSARAGEGKLLLVDGDPGIGKTRLVAELAQAAEAEGALVLWGRCDEDPVAPFQPFAEALGHYYQALSADRISRMPEWQLTELSRLVMRLREYVPTFMEDVGNPESDRYRFFEGVTATFNGLSPGGTVLVVIDDVHRADPATLLLLRHVLRNTVTGSVGVIGMYQDTEVHPEHPLRQTLADLRAAHQLVTVHLRGLSAGGVEELTRGWMQDREDLVPQLCRLTDGNPLFLDELLRQLREAEDGGKGDSEAQVSADLTPTEAIRELVARRVSRLPEDVIYLLQTAAVAGLEWDLGIVIEAAVLGADRGLDALDRAVESRLLRRVGEETADRYAFSHALVRDAIYSELLRGRRVRYHHRVAAATERAHSEALDLYLNELALHYSLGAPLADADKATQYCRAAGERALRLLAFEEAVAHFTRGLEVAEQYAAHDQATRCDILLALAEAQSRSGDPVQANANFDRAALLARALGDAERLAASSVRTGPLGYESNAAGAGSDHIELLEEARDRLPEKDSHLRALVTSQLGLVLLRGPGMAGPEALARALALNAEAVGMARRLGDRHALGYALNARLGALWGIASGSERLATAMELSEIAEEIGDTLLGLNGHMWRLRELLVLGDLDAVHGEIARAATRTSGPVHPLEISFSLNVSAMMALMIGDFDGAERAGRQAMEVAKGYSELVRPFYGALMWWTWWQRGELASDFPDLRADIEQTPTEFPSVRAAVALLCAEGGQTDQALAELRALRAMGWDTAPSDLSEGVSLAIAAAACSVLGAPARELAAPVYDGMRPFAGTIIVIRAPAVACVGPADHYLGLLTATMGDLALAEVHFEAALRMARRMGSPPFAVAAEVELARTLRRRRPAEEADRVATLLRSAEESALAMGLHRLARLAAEPG